MDLSKIYSKTGKGTRALSAKAKDLPKNALKVLPLIDSKTSVRTILSKLDKLSETDLHIALTQLESGGYIRVLQEDNWDAESGQSANPSSIVVEEVSHEDFLRLDTDSTSPTAPEPLATEPEAEDAALLQAQRVYQEFAERLAQETQKQAEQEAQLKALEAERKAREEAERAVAAERERMEAEAAATREADRLVKAEEARQAELAKILFEAEHAARLEAERVAREKAERAARLAEESRLRIEAEAREAAEKLALEEAKRKLREEEEARKQAEIERKAREAAEKKAKREEEARLKAEAKEQARLEKAAREEAERQVKQRAREEEEARRKAEAERIAEEEAERQAKREEAARREAEAREKDRLAKAAEEEAERQTREAEKLRLQAEEEARRKLEAERIAKEEPERRAQREEEARLKAEAEAKAAAEKQARLAADAQAKAEAEQREREAREAAKMAEAERKAEQEAALQSRKAEEAQRKTEAAEAKRLAKEEAQRETEARAQMKLEQKQRARAERVAKKIAAARERKRAAETGGNLAKLAKAVLIYLPLALVLVVVALHYVNLAPFAAAPVAQAASDSLGEQVRFNELRAALLPHPELRLTQVQVGERDALAFDTVRIEFALATLFDPVRRVERIEIENATLQPANLERMQHWFVSSSKARKVEIANVAFRNITFAVPDFKLPAFSGNFALAADGKVDTVDVGTQEGNLSLKLQPDNGAWKFTLDARAWQPPLRTSLKFDELRAEGVLRGQTAQFAKMEGHIYAGTFKGSAMAAWKDRPRISGHFVTENIRVEQATAAEGQSAGLEGALAADVSFSSANEDVQGWTDSVVANAKFTVTDGKVLGVDLASSMLLANRERSTRFDTLTGTLQSDATTTHLRQLVLESAQLRARGQLDVGNNREVDGKATAELLIPSRRMQADFRLGGKVGDLWIK